MCEGSGQAGTGLFCGAGNRDGGSGGRTGGLQITGFSVGLVPSLGVRLCWNDCVRFTLIGVSPFANADESESDVLSRRVGGAGLDVGGIRGGGPWGRRGLIRCRGVGLRTGPSF